MMIYEICEEFFFSTPPFWQLIIILDDSMCPHPNLSVQCQQGHFSLGINKNNKKKHLSYNKMMEYVQDRCIVTRMNNLFLHDCIFIHSFAIYSFIQCDLQVIYTAFHSAIRHLTDAWCKTEVESKFNVHSLPFSICIIITSYLSEKNLHLLLTTMANNNALFIYFHIFHTLTIHIFPKPNVMCYHQTASKTVFLWWEIYSSP